MCSSGFRGLSSHRDRIPSSQATLVMTRKMNVLLFSRYGSLGASSRVRHIQYLKYFAAHGISVSVSPLLSDTYLKALYEGRNRFLEATAGYGCRIRALAGVTSYDALIIEKELFPFLPTLFERFFLSLGVPYIVDYDDAYFHKYDLHSRSLVRSIFSGKIDSLMRHSELVIAGNGYLASRAHEAGANHVEVIPTVVDTERYLPYEQRRNNPLVIGWVGTPKTSRYLHPLTDVFAKLKEKFGVRFVAVGARPEDFARTVVEVLPWSEKKEVSLIQQFDIGIMPLDDSAWARGKCGYKLIQYMACGVPVVASPVGVNSEIVNSEDLGRLAKTPAEWYETLACLLAKEGADRAEMGKRCRSRVEAWYSLQVQAPRLCAAILSVAQTGRARS